MAKATRSPTQIAASTVSRAFSRPGRVNARTAERTFAAARGVGYRSGVLHGPTGQRTRSRPAMDSAAAGFSTSTHTGRVREACSLAATRAYAVHFSWCPLFGVVVNERGVKREGSVDPAEVPALLDRLTGDLLAIQDPDASGPVVLRVMRREEVADGPELVRLPHLFVEVSPRYFPDDGLRRREVSEARMTDGRLEVEFVEVAHGDG